LHQPCRRNQAILLRNVDVDEASFCVLRDDGNGSGPAERIEYDVAFVAVKLDEAVDEFFGKRR
jgi:hypothetical protein